MVANAVYRMRSQTHVLSIIRQPGPFLLALSFVLAGARHASPQNPPETLKEVLAAKSLPAGSAKLTNLEKKITSGAELEDSNQFTIAYYLDDGSGMLNPPLFVDRFDKKNNRWQSATLPGAQTKSPSVDDTCFGSILNIQAFGGRVFLDTHINPSAGCLLVLSTDLKIEASLYGWLVGQLGADILLYHRSEVHFAPVHPTEIALYDLRSKRDETIFPPKVPTAVRQERTSQLREFYKSNPGWCQKNNDPCDPEYFDSDLEGEIAASESEFAVAFLISYAQIQLVEGDLQKPSAPKEVLYVYRRLDDPAKMEFREMLWSDARTQFGDIPLQDLLQHETLKKIFSAPPLNKP